MKTNVRFVFALVLLAMAAPLTAQEVAPDEAANISKRQVEAYVSAFNKGDAKALAALYAEDTQHTSNGGVAMVGRAAVLENMAKYFAKKPGVTLAIEVESARFLTPEVLLEKGFATENDETTRYVCSYVKKDGTWVISELDETTLPPLDAASAALDDLGWLVGSWKDNSSDVKVTSTADWTNNGHFLRRSYTIVHEDGESTSATEVIGYDPVAGAVRSWMFDSDGGFGEGTWRQEGNKWINSYTGISPDGSTTTAQHITTNIGDKKYTWESVNRQRDGEILPNIDRIEVIRAGEE
ncbi:MAG: SgcJ/EcaC family oxidoreductase [Terrimicrobiaceae bacterium]